MEKEIINKDIVDIRNIYKEKLVYIDFESVSVPFAYDAGLGGEYPYAYSAAIYGDPEINTYIFESSNTWGNIKALRISLMEFLGIKSEEELNKFVFVGWNGGLEKKVLNQMFKSEFKYSDLMPSNSVFSAALDDIAAEDKPLELGFEYTRSLVNDKIRATFKKRKSGKLGDFEPQTDYKKLRTGAIACLIGAFKYGSMTTKGNKFIKNKLKIESLDIEKITSELRIYSKQDVKDMIVISDNFERSVRRFKFMKKHHLFRNAYKSDFMKFNGVIKKLLKVWDEQLTTSELFVNFVELNKSNYFNRAYDRLECDELDLELQDEVLKIANKYKEMDLKEIAGLKEFLIKESFWDEDFAKVKENMLIKVEEIRKYKDELKLKAKLGVKKVL